MVRLEERRPADPATRACLTAYYAELDARFVGGFKVEISRFNDDPYAEVFFEKRL